MIFLILVCLTQPQLQFGVQGLDIRKPVLGHSEQEETTKPVPADVNPSLETLLTPKPILQIISQEKVFQHSPGQNKILLDRDGIYSINSVTKQYVSHEEFQPSKETVVFENAANVSEFTKTTPVEEESLLGRRYHSPYSMEDLLNLVIPPGKISPDIDMDPCKAGFFIGDIAFPQNTTKHKENERFDVRDTISEPRVGRDGYKSRSNSTKSSSQFVAEIQKIKSSPPSSKSPSLPRSNNSPLPHPYTPTNSAGYKVAPEDALILKGSNQGRQPKQVQDENHVQDKSNVQDENHVQDKNNVQDENHVQDKNNVQDENHVQDKNHIQGQNHVQDQKLVQGHSDKKTLQALEDVLVQKQVQEEKHIKEQKQFEKQRKSHAEAQKEVQVQEINGKEAVPGQFEPHEDNLQVQPPEAGHKTKYAKEVNRGQDSEFENQNLKNKIQLWKTELTSNAGPTIEVVKSFEDGTVLEAANASEAASEDVKTNDDVSKENLRRRKKSKSLARIRHRRSKLQKQRRRRLLRQRPGNKADNKNKRIVNDKRKRKDRSKNDVRNERMEWDKARLRGQAPQAGGQKMKDEAEKRRKWRERIEKEMKEGKMLSQDRSGRDKRAATARPERIWDYAVIPYEIDSNFSGVHKALFKQAMRHWENYTCIQFVERTAEHPNWIVFTERPCGCCSFVGKRGNGPQAISIGKNCDKFGIVVHELGHVVGFWHEHTRPDRDNWVTILRENVILGQDYNFNKLTSEEVNSLGLRYDYDSIMHYARNTFSKGTYLDTILPRSDLPENQAALPEIGQRIRLSKGDILQTSSLYNCPACGKTYQDTAGRISSPQYSFYTPPPARDPQPFKKGDLCQWRILATHGEKIILNITSLDIPASVNCQLDYLEVRDGYWYKSPLLARVCGTTLSEPIISTGSRLMLTYRTRENSPDHLGFMAQYEAVCGGELDTETGQLESPNFPEDYQPSKECIWKIRVAEDFQVALKFQSFEIENHDNCVYDYLEIRDGDTQDSPLIGTYCGYKMPKDIKSSSNSLWIKFVSDGSVQKAGFSASFMKEYDECQSPDHGCEHECTNTLGGYTCNCRLGYELHSDERRCENACGGLIDASNGTITSPSFPDIYPSNKNCIWEVIAPPQWRITINFTHFDIEGNNQDCEYDSLAISSKMGSGEARQHGLFCGNRLPPVITSEGNSLRLEFLSDNSVQKNGFAAIFFTDKDECATENGGCQQVCRNTIGAYYCSCHQGFVLHENGHDCKEGGCKHEISGNRGEISSPHYPDYYPAKKECVWVFSTTAGHRIKLLFSEFELEPHQECAYDHIVVYDGHTTSQQILGRFCGSKLPHPLITTDSTMLLVFKSDASVQRKGFMAEHMTVCGGHLEADDTPNQIYSHAKFGDINYENKEDCDWIIEAPQAGQVSLSFITFELEEEQDCAYDFIEVFSGYDDSGASYGRFCGNKIPADIISTEEALLLRFKSDDTINSKGFSASYFIVDQPETKDYEYTERRN